MKARVELVLPNGGRYVTDSKVRPAVGEEVVVVVNGQEQNWGKAERVQTVFDHDEIDFVRVFLGPS